MLLFLPIVSVATTTSVVVSQARPPAEQLPEIEQLPVQEVIQPTEIRPLPGKLDEIPVFNSNSPEVVKSEGILLSTFPPQGMRTPSAHLNYPFQGRFDFFSHHISQARTSAETRSMVQGVLMYNPSAKPVRVEVLQASSYLTRPDALFNELPDYADNSLNNVFSGPGSRVMSDALRGLRQLNWQNAIDIPPGHIRQLMNAPFPAGKITPSSNTRSTFMRLSSNGPIHLANLAMYAPQSGDGGERLPTLEEWQNLLINGRLAGPRDLLPTPMNKPRIDVIYGRVAGISIGTRWKSQITDNPKSNKLTIPKPGKSYSYGISTLYDGTLGTRQNQSSKLAVRYDDTAYQSHGNYAVSYEMAIPLQNTSGKTQKVAVLIETPLKVDVPRSELLFFNEPESRIFFRGTVRIRFTDDKGKSQTRYTHIVQRRGQRGQPLVLLNMRPGERRSVQLDFLYPPDATPPQVLTVRTLD